ncbi:MAG: transporter substrate-binding domain-containing protein [Candidatus Babeliales bacterium]
MNNIYRSILIALSLITLTIWYTKRKKTKKQTSTDILVVGTNAEFPPFSFMENNIIVGFDIDIIKEVAYRLGKKITIKDMPFDALIPDIQLGNIQIIAAGMSPTLERAKRIFFTDPHLTNNPLVIVTLANKKTISGITDLIDKEVAVNEGYSSDLYMSTIEGPILIRLSSASIGDGILALTSGRVDAFVSAQAAIAPFFKKHDKQKFQIIPIPKTDEPDALAISKKYPALFEQIQKILTAMNQDGSLEKIKKKWGLA